jgi:hypothetical protein
MKWTIVRQNMGYDRIETHKAVEKMNKLYRNELTMFLNYFIPSVKLISKTRVGSKQISKHDKAKTPYQRVQYSKFIKKETKQILKQTKARLNPFELNKRIQSQIREIQNLSVYN